MPFKEGWIEPPGIVRGSEGRRWERKVWWEPTDREPKTDNSAQQCLDRPHVRQPIFLSVSSPRVNEMPTFPVLVLNTTVLLPSLI